MNFFDSSVLLLSVFFPSERKTILEVLSQEVFLKCYHKVHEIVEMKEMLNVDCNNSYRTRSKTPQLVTPKSTERLNCQQCHLNIGVEF